MLGSALVAVLLIVRAGDSRQVPAAPPANKASQQAHVDQPLIIERKAGKMAWRLKASKAEQELRGRMHLMHPELELYSDDGKRVPVTGDEAWFNPLTKAIEFRGNVEAHYEQWTVYCDQVSYDHVSDTLHIPGEFRVESRLTRARGKGLTAWRNDHHIRIEEGAWIEDYHPNMMRMAP